MKILVLGGNRFFGKTLSRLLIKAGHKLTLLNRGNIDDGLGLNVRRVRCNRKDTTALRQALGPLRDWDLVFDQICYEAEDARSVCDILTGRVGHYVFTSSQAVYGLGAAISEESFNPWQHQFDKDALSQANYAEAKRQCEAVFFGRNAFPVTAVRFPIVVGNDDYTRRLKWHLDRVLASEPIYFPNLNTRLSLIHSEDAARVLSFLGACAALGPVNAAPAEPLRLAALVDELELVSGCKAHLLDTPEVDAQSPYGIEQDWFMDVNRLAAVGFRSRPIAQWLRPSLDWFAGTSKAQPGDSNNRRRSALC